VALVLWAAEEAENTAAMAESTMEAVAFPDFSCRNLPNLKER